MIANVTRAVSGGVTWGLTQILMLTARSRKRRLRGKMYKKNVVIEKSYGATLTVHMDKGVAEKVKAAPWTDGCYHQWCDVYSVYACPRYNIEEIIAQIKEWANGNTTDSVTKDADVVLWQSGIPHTFGLVADTDAAREIADCLSGNARLSPVYATPRNFTLESPGWYSTADATGVVAKKCAELGLSFRYQPKQ